MVQGIAYLSHALRRASMWTAVTVAALLLAAADGQAQTAGQQRGQPSTTPVGGPQPTYTPGIGDRGFYFAGGAGVVVSQESDLPDSVIGTTKIHGETGFMIGGAAGYRFKRSMRAELELAYRRIGWRDGENNSNRVSMEGTANLTSLMGNFLFDFDLGGPIRPYAGLGVGISILEGDEVSVAGRRFSKISGDALAFQLIAGGAYRLSERIELTGDYRFQRTGRFEITDSANVKQEMSPVQTHGFMLGMRYNF